MESCSNCKLLWYPEDLDERFLLDDDGSIINCPHCIHKENTTLGDPFVTANTIDNFNDEFHGDFDINLLF